MKIYIISLTVGILAGLLYGVLNVRSPAPPVVALIGLMGMLIGEQLVPYGKQFFANSVLNTQQLVVKDTEHLHVSDSSTTSNNPTKNY